MKKCNISAGDAPARKPFSAGGWRVACMAAIAWAAGMALEAHAAPPPNIVLIIVDDLRFDDLACTGNTFVKSPHMDRIAAEGVMFRSAFSTTPLCSPSRATILTGLYPHTHGITDNTDRSPQSHRLATFPRALQSAGYRTGYVGKWHMGNDSSPRPGFDTWACLEGQGDSFNPELNVNGKPTPSKGYITDVLTDHARDFLRQKSDKPFFLLLAHKAMHPQTAQRADGSLSDPAASNFVPAERHKNLYAGVKIPRRPNEDDSLAGKPALQQKIDGLPPLSRATGSSDEAILGRLRMLASVDESTGDIFKVLEQTGQLEKTLVILTSDHGYFYGEHGLSVERRLAYEETIRIPLLMRYPALIKAGQKRDQLVTTLDFAPTLLELGRAGEGKGLQGHSLVPLLKENGPELREAFLIEYYTDKVFPRIRNMGYQAVRTHDWKYIHYVDMEGMDELYDLNRDPYEMRNRIADKVMAEPLKKMKETLADQLRVTGGTDRKPLR